MPERKWQPNFIENGMLVFKNLKDGKFDDLKSFKKKRKLENHLKTGLGNLYFEITRKGFERK